MKKIEICEGYIALVDNEDYPLVSQYKWRIAKRDLNTCYATASINGKSVSMHRLILDAKKGDIVDHINHVGLDNRRKNIRICTQRQNCMNKIKRVKENGIKYKGVWKDRNKYRACIRIHGKTTHLGSFDSQRDAALVYNGAAKALFGEYALLNKIYPTQERIMKHTTKSNAQLIIAAPDIFEALEKLAKLGNGDLYGNSNGNVIAQDALYMIDGLKRKHGHSKPE